MSGQRGLEMRGITKRFGPTLALSGVDLDVRAGEVHALIGENGAGKSTLMKVLSGAHRPDSGQMLVGGRPYMPRGPLDGRLAGIAMIYQELALAPHLGLAENVLLGREPAWGGFITRRALHDAARQALEEVGLGDRDFDRPVASLSIAEQQLVEIARALASDCRILVLDEPTSSLTSRDIERLFNLIARLKQRGRAIVYISHFLEEVTRIADRYTVLRDGAAVGTGNVEDAEHDRLVSLMVGRDVDDLYPRSPREPGPVLLEIEGLSSTHGLRGASLRLRRGEVVGIAGLIGAGRTTLLRTIFGLAPVAAGSVRVGTYSGHASPGRRWDQGVGLVSEDRKGEGLATSLPIGDNLTLSHLEGLGPGPLVWPKRRDDAAARWIDKLRIKCLGPGQKVQELSGGNQQKVALARLLHHDVDVWLLDEPTRGIDVGSKAEIFRLIDGLAAGSGAVDEGRKAVLMVSSYLPELLGVCDRIAVMSRGRLSEARAVSELDEHQILRAATGAEDGRKEPLF
ncbi:MAG: sugar ABC transporter ATP-binding protein [Planctomycetota bacterium]